MPREVMLCCLVLFTSGRAQAQELYDKAPPPDAAFVRVFNAEQSAASVSVGRLRFTGLEPGEISPYRVLPKGSQEASSDKIATLSIDAQPGQHYTLALDEGALFLFEDEPARALAKASLSLYNLSDDPSISLTTADGQLKVIEEVGPSTVSHREVNAISVDLAVVGADDATLPIDSLVLERQESWSIFVYERKGEPTVAVGKASTQTRR